MCSSDLPLPRMGEYTNGIERINIELSLRNKLQLLDALQAFLARGNLPLGRGDDAGEIPSAELLEDRVQQSLALLSEVRMLWSGWLEQLDVVPTGAARTVFEDIQDGTLRASWKAQVRQPLRGRWCLPTARTAPAPKGWMNSTVCGMRALATRRPEGSWASSQIGRAHV